MFVEQNFKNQNVQELSLAVLYDEVLNGFSKKIILLTFLEDKAGYLDK